MAQPVFCFKHINYHHVCKLNSLKRKVRTDHVTAVRQTGEVPASFGATCTETRAFPIVADMLVTEGRVHSKDRAHPLTISPFFPLIFALLVNRSVALDIVFLFTDNFST
ncbi:hypothetical protein CHARACLAT_016008 [Characodon lateralis]|uniref:Uncharacterized protein n=1 Tax=Characodon lateralis TaxID=208331 RepID=A0ABU7CSN4_9TELE|nr:hypothetical protein [Characodon lateralis]